MIYSFQKLVISGLLVSVVGVAEVSADVSLRWQDVGNDTSPLISQYLADSNIVSDFVSMVDASFEFDPSLVIDVAASSGPDYDVETNTIRLPVVYLEQAIRGQATLQSGTEDLLPASGDEALVVNRALAVYEYTLYHLLGHALIRNNNVESDASAEALSSWLMIDYWPNGGEQWLENIAAFGDASQKLDGPLTDYWHAHSLYLLRQRAMQCWVLGSDVERYEAFLPAVLDPLERSARCQRSYQKLRKTALDLVELQLLPDATLRRDVQ